MSRIPLDLTRKLLTTPSRNFFFKKNTPKPSKTPVPVPQDPQIAIKSRFSDLIAALPPRLPLSNLSPSKLTLFVEPEELFFFTLIPHQVQGFVNIPSQQPDFTIECNDEQFPVGQVFVNSLLDQLLEEIRRFNVVLYTSMRKEVAESILSQIGQSRFSFIENRFYQQDCVNVSVESEEIDDLVKVLDGFNVDLKKTVVLDTNPVSFLLCTKNGLPVPAYAPQFTYQLDEFKRRLREVEGEEDVRELLERKYHIGSIFGEINYE